MIGSCNDNGINVVSCTNFAKVVVDADLAGNRSGFAFRVVRVHRLLSGLSTERFALTPEVISVVKRIDIANGHNLRITVTEELVEQVKPARSQADDSTCDPFAWCRSAVASPGR